MHHRLQSYDDAAKRHRQALDAYTDMGNRWGEAHALGGLGGIQLAVGDPEAARASWEQALAIFEEFDHPDADEIRGRLRRLDKHAPDAHHRSSSAACTPCQTE